MINLKKKYTITIFLSCLIISSINVFGSQNLEDSSDIIKSVSKTYRFEKTENNKKEINKIDEYDLSAFELPLDSIQEEAIKYYRKSSEQQSTKDQLSFSDTIIKMYSTK